MRIDHSVGEVFDMVISNRAGVDSDVLKVKRQAVAMAIEEYASIALGVVNGNHVNVDQLEAAHKQVESRLAILNDARIGVCIAGSK